MPNLPICPADHSLTPPNCLLASPPDFSPMLNDIDFSSVISGLITVMASLAVVFLVTRGGSLFLSKIAHPKAHSGYYVDQYGREISPDEDDSDVRDGVAAGVYFKKEDYEKGRRYKYRYKNRIR